jgi:ABC-type transporter Mla subunit MlaD
MSTGPRILWSQLRIGVLTTAFFTVVSLGVFFIDQVRDSIEDRYTLYFHTFTLQTIQPRAPVWLAGIPVGHVVDMEFLPPATDTRERLRVVLSVSAIAQPFISEGARAQVITSGLLGEAVVNVLPATEAGAPLGDRGELSTARGLDPFEVTRRLRSLYDSVPPVAERWDEVLRQVREGRGSLPRLVRKPSDLLELQRNLSELSASFDTLRIAADRFRSFVSEPDVREALGRLGPRLGQITEQWQETDGSIGEFSRDSMLTSHIEAIAATLERLNRRVEGGRGTLGRLLNDRILDQELARTREMLGTLRSDLGEMRR